MTRRLTFVLTLVLCTVLCSTDVRTAESPRLVVVIIVDQFPYEYLVRFRAQFGPGGFRRLLEAGAVFTNAVYKHGANLTGPGHAVILSGAYGNANGIITNNWYDLSTHTQTNCVSDPRVAIVGGSGAGRSPALLIGSTYGDELRLTSGFRSKTISLSHKDRAAILLGGKLANAAYWMSDSSFVTSTYYLTVLPPWVQQFNRSGLITSYFSRYWRQTLPEAAFAGVDVDDAPYEDGGDGLGRVFPHRIAGSDTTKITRSFYHNLISSPYGSEALLALAKAAVRGEQLGKRGVTDLLCVSFSSSDYVGHAFGPHSREVLEMAVHMDRVVADFLAYLDKNMGANGYTLALTSDHGVAPIPEYITSRHPTAEAGRVPSESIARRIEESLNTHYGSPASKEAWVERIVDRNIYFNRNVLRSKGVGVPDAARIAADGLRTLPPVAGAYIREQMCAPSPASVLEQKVARSYHPLRSGDLFYVLKPYYLEGSGSEGTTHGEPYDYSAHVPLILFGSGVKAGVFAVETSPVDLAPTLSAITGVEFPAGREGKVLTQALR